MHARRLADLAAATLALAALAAPATALAQAAPGTPPPAPAPGTPPPPPPAPPPGTAPAPVAQGPVAPGTTAPAPGYGAPYGPPPPGYGPPPPGYGPPPPGYGPPVPGDTQPPAEPPGQMELVGDFAGLGVMAGITIDLRGVHDPGVGTLVILGSAAGGGATGWLLADRFHATRGDAYLTTLGLTLGAANGALLLRPTHNTDDAESVMAMLTGTSAIGTIGGFVASKKLDLTPGQAIFATDVTFLGVGTSALVAALMDKNNQLDDRELSALAVGLDGGAVLGLVLAPRIKWSQGRARVVGAATLVGTLVGGVVGGLAAPRTTNPDGTAGTDINPDYVSSAMMLGMWGGFGAAAYLTRDMAPDPRYDPRFHPPAGAPPARPPVAVMPLVRGDSFGVSMAGQF